MVRRALVPDVPSGPKSIKRPSERVGAGGAVKDEPTERLVPPSRSGTRGEASSLATSQYVIHRGPRREHRPPPHSLRRSFGDGANRPLQEVALQEVALGPRHAGTVDRTGD